MLDSSRRSAPVDDLENELFARDESEPTDEKLHKQERKIMNRIIDQIIGEDSIENPDKILKVLLGTEEDDNI